MADTTAPTGPPTISKPLSAVTLMAEHYQTKYGNVFANEETLKATGGYKMPVAFKVLKAPVLKYSIVLMVAALVVAWIVMMVGAKRLHEARKLGEWKQNECGQEYMEAETARYEMSKVYESSVRRYIYVSLTMFMCISLLSVFLMAVFSSESAWAVFKEFGKLQKLFGPGASVLFESPDKMVGLAIVVSAGTLIWQTSELSKIWMDRLSEKSYKQATTIAAATEDINQKHMPALIATTVISVIAMAVIVFVMYNKIFKSAGALGDSLKGLLPTIPDAPPMTSLIIIVVMFAIGLGLAMGLVKSYGLLNAHFSEYKKKTGEINDNLTEIVNESTTSPQISDYLLQNIHRIDPKAELKLPNVLSTNYKSDYYGYAMHEDGTELKFLNTNRVTITRAQGTIEALKDELAVLVQNSDIRNVYKILLDNALAKVAASATLMSDKPEVSINGLQTAITNAFKPKAGEKPIPVYLNDALRFEMHQRLKADASDTINVSSLRAMIDAFVKDRVQMLPNMGYAEIMGIINTELIAKLFPTLTGADLDNAKIAREDTKRDAIIEWFKCNASKDNGLCAVILLESLGTYIGNRASAVATSLLVSDAKQAQIRDGMSMLRQNSLSGKADDFINMVYIWSLVIALMFAYIGFHIIYRRNPAMVTIGSVIAILGLVLALSFYGWFMGQAM